MRLKTFALLKTWLKEWKKTWEKIFANYISEQGLHPEYIDNSENSVRRKQKTHFQKKLAKNLNWHFTKKNIHQ